MARGQQPRPQSGCVIGHGRRDDGVKSAAAVDRRNGADDVHPPMISPSKMVRGIADDDDDNDDDDNDGDRRPSQKVRGYTLRNYTTIQVTNRLKPPPGYPPNYYRHDPSSASLAPPPGYPTSYVSRKVRVIPDGRGRLTKSIVTRQPSSGSSVSAAATIRVVCEESATSDVPFPSSPSSSSTTTTIEGGPPPPPTTAGRPFVPPGILGDADANDYPSPPPPTTTSRNNGTESNCTTPGSYSEEWNYEFVHEKSYAYIEALKYSSPSSNYGDNKGGPRDGFITSSHVDLPNGVTNQRHLRVEKRNDEIYEYLDDDVLANALSAMPARGNFRYGSVKEMKKHRAGKKKSWIESHLNSSSSSSDEKGVATAAAAAAATAAAATTTTTQSFTKNNHSDYAETEGLGTSSGPDASSLASSSHKPKLEQRKIASTSKLTGILSRLSPKLIHRRCSSTGRILLTASDSAVEKSRDGGVDDDSEPSNVEVSTSGVSDVSVECDNSKVEEESPSSESRRGRSPVRNFFKNKGFNSSKSKSPSGSRLFTSFRSSSTHKDKDTKDHHRKSDLTSSQFSLTRRLRKFSKDEGKDCLNGGNDPTSTTVAGEKDSGTSSASSKHNNDGRDVGIRQQKICQSEGAILVSSGGGRKYHVVEIPLDDDDDDDPVSANEYHHHPRPDGGKGDAAVGATEEEENPEEEEAEIHPPSSSRLKKTGLPPPPLPPHGAKSGADHCDNVAPSDAVAPPGSLQFYPSSTQSSAHVDIIARRVRIDGDRLQDESIGDCSIDMNLSTGSTTVADGSLDFEDDQRFGQFFGSQATLEPADAHPSALPPAASSATPNAPPHAQHYRGVFLPIGGGFQPPSSAGRGSLSTQGAGRLQSVANGAVSAAPSTTSSSSHMFSPMSPPGSSSLCSSSVSSQPIPVPASSNQGSMCEVKSISSSSVASPLGGRGQTSLHSNSIGSPPSDGGAMDHSSNSASSRKPSYLSISMSVSGYSHYRRAGTSLSFQPGRTFSSSSLTSRGSGSLASVGSSAFSYSTNEASHGSHGRVRELSGGGAAVVTGGAVGGWRGSSVPPLGRDQRRQVGDVEPTGDSTVDVVPLSTCLMDKLCMGCGPASPPSLSASSRLDTKRQKPYQQHPTPPLKQQHQQQQQQQQQQPQQQQQQPTRQSEQLPASSVASKPNSNLSSSSSSSSSRRESRAEPFAASSHQRNTVIRLSPDEPSTTTLSTSADHLSSEATTLMSQREESTSPEGEVARASQVGGRARESVVVEAMEIVERIKKAERMKREKLTASERRDTDEDKNEGKVTDVVKDLTDIEEAVENKIGTMEVGSSSIRKEPNYTNQNTTEPLAATESLNGKANGEFDVRDEMIVKDGSYFLTLMRNHESRIKKFCIELETIVTTVRSDPNDVTADNAIIAASTATANNNDNNAASAAAAPTTATTINNRNVTDTSVPEEVCGKIRACIGKANLLTSKKFKQFEELCEKNLSPSEDDPFPTTDEDLAGFWDLVTIQIEEINSTHDEIMKLKANRWKPDRQNVNKKKATVKQRVPKAGNGEKRSAAAVAAAAARAKAREDARKKLINSKRMQQKQQQKMLQETGENGT